MEMVFLVVIAQWVCPLFNVPALISSLSSLSLARSKTIKFKRGNTDLQEEPFLGLVQ